MNKKNLLLVVIVLLFVIGLLYGITRTGGKRQTILREGDLAHEFSLRGLDGKIVNLSAYRGKVVMVHFWATWCPPCVEEIPVLERLYRTMPGRDFEILAISVDEGGPEVVGPFSRGKNLTFPILLDPDRSTATRYGTFKFPETYVLDREGIVRFKAIGAMDWMHPENLRSLTGLINAAGQKP